MKEIKISFIFLLFYPLPIFYPPLLRFLIPMSCLSPFDFLPLIVLTTLNICITWLELHFGKQNVSNIVDHSIFSDYTCSIGHSKIYSNYLFIYFCKKRKEKKKSTNKLCKLQCVNSYYITFALFFLIHCQTFFPLYQYSYTKKKKHLLKKNNQKKNLKVYMTSQIINSETKTILKLNTYKTKQRIK